MSARQKQPQLPVYREEFEKHRTPFEAWLVARGAEVLERTNEWEVIRFSTATGIAVVHADKRGAITSWGNGSAEVFKAYRTNAAWRGNPKPKTHAGQWKRDRLEAVLARDGNTCTFCALAMSADDRTLEHFVPLAAGGTNHLSNLLAAHEACNQRAGHLSARQKIELIVTMRTGGTA